MRRGIILSSALPVTLTFEALEHLGVLLLPEESRESSRLFRVAPTAVSDNVHVLADSMEDVRVRGRLVALASCT